MGCIQSDLLIDNMRVNRLFGLKDLIEENLNKETVMCEVGSYEGVSSELFAYFCKTVYCVDTFIQSYYEESFDKVVQRNNNIVKVKGKSPEISEQFKDEFFDFVYIDANHIYQKIKRDIICWMPKIKKGGLMGGHDYVSSISKGGVVKAVNELFGKDNIKIYEDSSWIVEK